MNGKFGWYLLALIVTCGPSTLQVGLAQVTANRSGVIRGRVVSAETGRPLRRAQLRLSGPGLPAVSAGTDTEGRYEFRDLPAGRFTLRAAKTGYVSLSYGQRHPSESSRPIELGERQSVDDVEFSLPVGASVIVHVLDDVGDPIAGVPVNLDTSKYIAGQRMLGSAPVDEATTETDDQGVARFSGAPPGSYYVSAVPARLLTVGANDSRRLLAATYYPGFTDVANALKVDVGVGGVVDVSFPLQQARSATIEGIARDSRGQPIAGPINIVQQINGSRSRAVPLRADGGFVIEDLSPGSYRVTAAAVANDSARETGALTFSVAGEDLSGLMLRTTPGATVRGRIVFDTGSPPADIRPGVASVSVMTAGYGPITPGTATVQADWSFEMTGVTGRALVRPMTMVGNILSPTGPPGWFLRAVMYEGVDVTDVALDFSGQREFRDVEILLTKRQATLHGNVVDEREAPVVEYAVVVFPPDPSLWKFRSRFIAAARSDRQGGFNIGGLPPGEYLVAALSSLEDGQETDPQLLKRLEKLSSRVRLSDGDVRDIRLVVMP